MEEIRSAIGNLIEQFGRQAYMTLKVILRIWIGFIQLMIGKKAITFPNTWCNPKVPEI
jgi:hypothetical protein